MVVLMAAALLAATGLCSALLETDADFVKKDLANIATEKDLPDIAREIGLPDIAAILEKAREVQETDIAAWRHYQFRRRSEREDQDESGGVVKREVLEFLMTPTAEGFDELLERIDGREPAQREISHYRRLGRFTRNYRMMVTGSGNEAEARGYSLGDLLHLSSHRYVGQEAIDGVSCHRFDFRPDESKEGRGLRGNVTQVLAGSLWITVDGLHLYRARASMVKPVPIYFFLAKIYTLELRLESEAVSESVYLPRRIEMHSSGRILIMNFRRHHVFTYSDFRDILRDQVSDP